MSRIKPAATRSGEARPTPIASSNVREQSGVRTVESVLLIWLDDNSNCKETLAQLRRCINTINTFTDVDACTRFIETIRNEKICLLVSDVLAQEIIPRVHSMPQVNSIFIYSYNNVRTTGLTRSWSKIKDVFTDIPSVCQALKQAAQCCEHNAVSMSFMARKDAAGGKKRTELHCSFMYTQILKEIILGIDFGREHFEQFVDYCRQQFAKNDHELNNIDKFEREYRLRTPIWWYTYECFLYPMLNRALRTMDAALLVNLGFYIADLHHQIERLHSEQFGTRKDQNTFTVYRGQGLSPNDFEQLKASHGGLMAFNNFLSTSRDRRVSLSFAHQSLSNMDMMGILFVMTIDPSQATTPFACITEVGYYADKEDEILFSMHSIFCIQDIEPCDGNSRLFQVNLMLTSKDDDELQMLTHYIRDDVGARSGWHQLGIVLDKMGQLNKAEEVYRVLLDRTTTRKERGPIYHQLGCIKDRQGEYEEAIEFYAKTLEIDRDIFPSNHLSLASSYNNIGEVYRKMGDYPRALSYYEKTLQIQRQSYPENHSELSCTYNNMGIVYGEMDDYSKALAHYQKSLDIRQQSLPPNHPELASSYNNIGSTYVKMGDYSKALSYYEQALEIQQRSLPPGHPDFGTSYNNIGSLYGQMGEYRKALSYFEKDLAVSQQVLPPNHPDLGMSCKNIGMAYDKLGEHSKARSYYERAMNIVQRSLPSDHPHLLLYRKLLDEVKTKL